MKKYILFFIIILSSPVFAQHFFAFSSEFRIKQLTVYSEKDNTLSETYIYEYDNHNRLVKEIIDSKTTGTYTVKTHDYDNNGQLILTEVDNGFEESKCIIYYTYGTTSNGSSTLLTYTYPNSEDGYEYHEEFYYNKTGNLTQSIYSDMYFSAGNFYEYDDSGSLVLETDNTATYSTEYIYNNQNLIIRAAQKEMDFEHTISEYQYDNNNRLISILYDIDIPELIADIEYNRDGNVSNIRKVGLYKTSNYIIEWEPGTPDLKTQEDLFWLMFIYYTSADLY